MRMKNGKKNSGLSINFFISGVLFILIIGSFHTMAFSVDPPFFDDDVSLYRDSLVRLQAESGVYYNISGTSALAALNEAAIIGGFEYEISDEWIGSFGLFLSEVEGRGNEGYDGWQFWVNYPDEDIPMAAAENYELENGDLVDWYYGGYGINPDDSIMDIKIHVQIEEDTSYPSIDITIPKRGGIYLQGRELSNISPSHQWSCFRLILTASFRAYVMCWID